MCQFAHDCRLRFSVMTNRYCKVLCVQPCDACGKLVCVALFLGVSWRLRGFGGVLDFRSAFLLVAAAGQNPSTSIKKWESTLGTTTDSRGTPHDSHRPCRNTTWQRLISVRHTRVLPLRVSPQVCRTRSVTVVSVYHHCEWWYTVSTPGFSSKCSGFVRPPPPVRTQDQNSKHAQTPANATRPLRKLQPHGALDAWLTRLGCCASPKTISTRTASTTKLTRVWQHLRGLSPGLSFPWRSTNERPLNGRESQLAARLRPLRQQHGARGVPCMRLY